MTNTLYNFMYTGYHLEVMQISTLKMQQSSLRTFQGNKTYFGRKDNVPLTHTDKQTHWNPVGMQYIVHGNCSGAGLQIDYPGLFGWVGSKAQSVGVLIG